ncbi:MAG: hypothetical protein J6B98_03160 [Bacilli bacterium]|nr:hypothetical protein [Bacilli bacterium]
MKNLSKKQKLISFILFIVLLGAFIFVGTRDYEIKEVDEHKVFSNEYKIVPNENVFVYVNSSKIYTSLKSGSSIIFFGFSKNEFSGHYAKIINEVATEKGIKEILYYDFYEDRENYNGTYESIVLLLEDYLNKNDLGKVDLVAPSMVVVKNGKILFYDEETAYTPVKINPDDYWNEYNVGIKKATLGYIFDEYLEVFNGEQN